jgi:hypothetical protein
LCGEGILTRDIGFVWGPFERGFGGKEEGVTHYYGVWGTPTLVFNGRQAAYLKVRPAPPPEEAAKLFEELYDIIYRRPYVVEVKGPRVP